MAWPPRTWFTYKRQRPDDATAWRIGEAHSKASKHPAGDYIDRGLALLKELQDKGYGIVELDDDGKPKTEPRP